MHRIRKVVLSNTSYRSISAKKLIFRFKYSWIAPSGHDTGIKVYSRVKDDKVSLTVSNKHLVKWYICGPTVYDVSHIGHASCYIRFDIIRRILLNYFDINPIVALGITDVDDKIITRANAQKVDFKSLAKKYELQFFKNLNELNVLPPTIILRVSEHIPEIINFIKVIINKNHAYATKDGSVYFNTNSFNNYGKLCSIPTEGFTSLKEGQKSFLDFALWKGVKPGEPFWESPWGKGRPGWHIECSAMSSKLFGSAMDLHGGGIDLVFPHHENEEIQSCSYHGCEQWVNYWLHAGALMVNDEKMSKSLRNFISVDEFLESYNPDTFRMFCFISSYRKGLHFGDDSIKLALENCEKISSFLADSSAYVKGSSLRGNVMESELLQKLEETKTKVEEHLKDDFNTSACHLELMNLLKICGRMLSEESQSVSSRCPSAVAAVSQYIKNAYESFGFRIGNSSQLQQPNAENNQLDFILNAAVNFRREVREEALSCSDKSLKKSLLQACDSFRYNLDTVGVRIKDESKTASSWGKVQNFQTK